MPSADTGAMVPLSAIVQKGYLVHTRSMAEQDELVAICPDVTKAAWLAWGLSQFHGVPHKIEPPDPPSDDIAPEIDDVKRRLAAAEVIEAKAIGTWVL